MTDEKPKRHGCLTTLLVVMIIFNAIAAIMYLTSSKAIARNLPSNAEWAIPVLTLACILNVVFAVALFNWKKWGFYGFCAISVIALIINLSIGLNPVQAVLGLVGIAVLYWVLNMGGENKAWPRLE